MTTSRFSRNGLRPLVAFGAIAASLGVAGCSSSSTTSATTTSGLDPDVAQVIKLGSTTAEAAGLMASDFKVTAEVSPANDSWMIFHVTPNSSAVQPFYGYAHQAQTWSVVAHGSANVGCPASPGATPTVPLSVIKSFGLSCPTS